MGWVVEVERGEDHKHTKFTDDEIHNSLCIKRNLGEPNQKLESDGGRRAAGRGGTLIRALFRARDGEEREGGGPA